MTKVQLLNRRLGESLGYVQGGSVPRFQWISGPNIPYFPHHDAKYYLCQFKPTEWSESEWHVNFRGRYPYVRGFYHVHGETAVPYGSLTEQLNANYIWALDRQISLELADHLYQIKQEIERDQKRDKEDWLDYCMGDAENSGLNSVGSVGALTRVPGTRGDSISFGGI
jgi:hypothetical protein